MQLPHVARMSEETDWRLRQHYDLTDAALERFTYRVNSFFQLASTSRTVTSSVQLQDHHRSHPSIAGYCNETFYGKTLRINTGTESLRPPRGRESGIHWTQVPDDSEAAPGGGAVSQLQIASIITELRRLAASKFGGTVGIVTPFRGQATRLRDQIEQQIGDAVPQHWRLHVDTADGFQGDERDVILFSLVGGAALPQGALWFLRNSPNRFNVAVSRARAVLHVFGDLDWARSCGVPHIEQLVRAMRCNTSEDAPIRTDLIGPVWEPKLAEALRARDIHFRQQYPTCGRYLDFAIIQPGMKLDVEVDGEQSHRDGAGRRKVDDLHRDLVLIAAGWTVLRFWVYELREDMSRCIDKIEALIRERGTET